VDGVHEVVDQGDRGRSMGPPWTGTHTPSGDLIRALEYEFVGQEWIGRRLWQPWKVRMACAVVGLIGASWNGTPMAGSLPPGAWVGERRLANFMAASAWREVVEDVPGMMRGSGG
jgi:hypothetical protein